MSMEKTGMNNSNWVSDWKEECGQIKVILKVNSGSELNDYFIDVINANLPVVKVHDAGKTQIEPNTVTCIGIGPVPAERIDPIIKDLKCYDKITISDKTSSSVDLPLDSPFPNPS